MLAAELELKGVNQKTTEQKKYFKNIWTAASPGTRKKSKPIKY